eukprot:CAMPEP_0202912756 /NCGR_PEP_ID=MMETSP1392-20130828/58577_1 /ASSEMBLY_ACC=CAM_ASM_000868 /TAXON_ID=225041 /ORGANISM="Chlamydomonas chlamydogama, Strain SAG 11-48b" /LENGTH=45 /DNA_ID= /DNA_START= /DNA_END= /DNA_ORIENTATION=
MTARPVPWYTPATAMPSGQGRQPGATLHMSRASSAQLPRRMLYCP